MLFYSALQGISIKVLGLIKNGVYLSCLHSLQKTKIYHL